MGLEDEIRQQPSAASVPEPPPSYDVSGTMPQAFYTHQPGQPPMVLPGQPQAYGFQPQQPQAYGFQQQQQLPVHGQQPYGYQPQPPPMAIPGQVPYATYQPMVMHGAPIVIQPGAPQTPIRWIAPGTPPQNCPQGLEFLAGLSKIVVRQKQDLIEIVTPIETPNRYSIETESGELVYFAAEDPDHVQAQVMGSSRGYKIKCYDGYNRVAFTIARPLQYCKCECCACCDGCKRTSTIEGSGQLFGGMRTRRACCASSLTITDENGRDIITIDGPCCCDRCCSDADFPLISAVDRSTLGFIKRRYLGYIQSTYSKADVFDIEFPRDLDVKVKASIIGACIMIDFLEFEINTNRNNQRANN